MKALFQNPKMALAYVGIVMAGVALFVGTEDSPGSLDQTVESFGGGKAANRNQPGRKFGDPAPGEERIRGEQTQEVIEFVPDEELIDDARGFDPNPTEDFSGFSPNPDDGPYLADQDKKKAAESQSDWGTPEN